MHLLTVAADDHYLLAANRSSSDMMMKDDECDDSVHRRKERKQVRFSSSGPLILNALLEDKEHMSDDTSNHEDDPSVLWYSPQELAQIRAKTQRVCENVFQEESRCKEGITYTQIMAMVVEACQQASCRGVTSRSRSSCDSSFVLTPSLQQMLVQCVQQAPELYGLERYFVWDVVQLKMQRRAAILALVLGTQRQLSSMNNGMKSNTPQHRLRGSGGRSVLLPCDTIHYVSQPCCLLARVTAQVSLRATAS